VQGVKSTNTRASAFQDDEFVVYNTSQIVLKYLIEYGAPDTSLSKWAGDWDADLQTVNPEIAMVAVDQHYRPETPTKFSEEPITFGQSTKKLKIGLVSNSGAELPLKSVAVKAKILDLASEVVVFQKFRNDSGTFFLLIFIWLIFYFLFYIFLFGFIIL
jgi:poly [ADP-ribose] polymerase